MPRQLPRHISTLLLSPQKLLLHLTFFLVVETEHLLVLLFHIIREVARRRRSVRRALRLIRWLRVLVRQVAVLQYHIGVGHAGDRPRQAIVTQLDRAVLVYKDIGGLEIPVDYFTIV